MSLLLYGLMSRSMATTAAAAGSASARATAAQNTSARAERTLELLEERVETLSLLVLALAETLKQRTGAADEEILRQVNLLDLRDGVADGKLNAAARTCAKCDRAVSARHARCIYCGGEVLGDLPPGTVESLLR